MSPMHRFSLLLLPLLLLGLVVPARANPPVAVDDHFTVHHDTALTGNILANDTGDYPLSLNGLTPLPQNGMLSLNSNGSFIYQPYAGFVGTDSFAYQAYDGFLYSAAATVTIEVTDTPPIANAGPDQTVVTAGYTDTTALVTLDGSGSSDPDGDPLAYTWRENGQFLAFDANATVMLAIGTHNLTLTVSDGAIAVSAPVTVTVQQRIDQPPVANPDSFTGVHDRILTISAPGLLANDTDPDGDLLHSVFFSPPQHGHLFYVNPDGSFSYVPDRQFVGTDSFSYQDQDGFITGSAATVTLTITNANPIANAGPDQTVLAAGSIASVTLDGSGSSDPDSDPLNYAWSEGGTPLAPASASSTATANLAAGLHTITLTVTDSAGATASDTVTVTVQQPPNHPPVAQGQNLTTYEDTPRTISLGASDADGDPLTYSIVTPPLHGSLSGGPTNPTYTPLPNYNGPDSFTFKVNDGKVDSNIATVSLTVIPVNDPPVAVDDAAQGARKSTLAIDVLANDFDVDGDSLTIVAVGTATVKRATVTTDGTRVYYTPPPGFRGTDTFSYTISDASGATVQAQVTVTIR